MGGADRRSGALRWSIHLFLLIGRLLRRTITLAGPVVWDWSSPACRFVVPMLRWVAAMAALCWGLSVEARTSYFQSRIFSNLTRDMSFAAEPGPSHSIRFPKGGPYDERLSYVGLPMFLASLSAQRFTVQRQADWSAALDRFVDDSVTCEEARQEVYGWLYKANSTHKQDLRIRILLKQDAFNRILQDW